MNAEKCAQRPKLAPPDASQDKHRPDDDACSLIHPQLTRLLPRPRHGRHDPPNRLGRTSPSR
jgi:hypothetical protein